MRRFVSVICAGLMTAAPAMAAQRCANPTNQAIFDVAALRSEVMVLATACKQSSAYNAFIERFRPALVANEREMDTYFRRHFGRAAQHEHDSYTTSLANSQSEVGIREGSDFCPRNGLIFHEVMSLSTSRELPEYAAAKDLVPQSLGVCVLPERVAERATRARRPIERRR